MAGNYSGLYQNVFFLNTSVIFQKKEKTLAKCTRHCLMIFVKEPAAFLL